MPKEYVNDAMHGEEFEMYNLDEGGNPVPIENPEPPKFFQVKVGWSRETDHVQIATVDEEADLGSSASGLYVNLNRQGINDLIRHLRRARDQAFGRDE